MAITVTDLGTTAQTNNASPTHASVTAATGDILVAAIHSFYANPAPLATACVFSGESFTLARTAGPKAGGGSDSWGSVALFYLVVASGDTADVVGTLEFSNASESSWITVWKVEGGNTASPIGDTDELEDTSTASSTLTLTTTAGDVVFTAAVCPDGWTDLAISPQSGTTADYQNDAAGTGAIVEVAAGHREAAGSSTAVGWDVTYAKPLMHAAIVIQADAGGGGGGVAHIIGGRIIGGSLVRGGL